MARKKGTIKSFPALWAAHETLYCEIFSEALNRLTISEEQRQDEDAISEALCPVLRVVCFEHNGEVQTPEWEKPITPISKNDLSGGKKRKRPDFTCSLVNPLASNPKEHEISFHVECKRLGESKSSWNLNKNYVCNGLTRFISKSHEYGKLAPSGLMIGYMINSTPLLILKDVNKHLKNKFPEIDFSFSRKVASENQKLVRIEVLPIDFKLIHLWVNFN